MEKLTVILKAHDPELVELLDQVRQNPPAGVKVEDDRMAYPTPTPTESGGKELFIELTIDSGSAAGTDLLRALGAPPKQ